MPPVPEGYWRATRAPRYSVLFAVPLLALYEALAFLLSGGALAGVRNGADVLLKSLFIASGGRDGLIAFGVLLVGVAAVLVWRDMRGKDGLRAGYFAGMTVEACVYALAFGLVASQLTSLLLQGLPLLALGPVQRLDLPTQLMISLGAGLYEELLFRVLLVSGLAILARRVFGVGAAAAVFAVLLGAFVFSAFHYIGPFGDPLELGSFTFRAVAGVMFSGLYLARGFGITAWTHALYDAFLALAGLA